MDYGSALIWLVAATLAGNLICPPRARPVVLLVGSFLFLALWNLPGLGVLLLVTTLAYVAGLAVEGRPSHLVVGCSAAGIVLPLCLLRFNASNTLDLGLVSGEERRLGLLGPFGLSFFTLQAVGYVLDLRFVGGRAKRRWLPVALYLAFFPKLLAGPIERAGTFIPQLRAIPLPGPREIVYAGKCILLGLFSKFVLASTLARIGEDVTRAESVGGAVLALACVTYSYEIYLDFFAYSIMAIGLAKLLGIELSDNFHTPYAAPTLREFWRRWHMTLSFWFRDYLYKPLGGGRTSERRRWAVVMLVFLCSGLWHGSAWNFVCWGGLHGALYLLGTSTVDIRRRIWSVLGLARWPKIHRLLQTTSVFMLVTAAWVFFRSPRIDEALDILGRAVGLRSPAGYWSLGSLGGGTILLACGLLVGVALLDLSGLLEILRTGEPSNTLARVGELAAIDGMLLGLILVGSGGGLSFIYFNF